MLLVLKTKPAIEQLAISARADDSYSMRHTVLEIKNDFLPKRNFDSEKRHHFTPKQTRSHAAANHSFYANPLPKLANNQMVHFQASPQHANEYLRDDESKKSLLAYGRTTKFTTGFVNHIMFSDNTIVAATNHKLRLENSIVRMKDREQKKISKLETLQRKKFIAQFYVDKHNVEATPYDLDHHTVEELEVVLRKRTLRKKEYDAAVCIQKHARRLVTKKRYQ